MASTRELRQRIKSVKSIKQVTKAMQLVSAAKMRKAQDAATAGKTYTGTLRQVLAAMADRVSVDKHPLLKKNSSQERAIIFVSSDRGLAGALNSNLFKEAQKIEGTVDYITLGKKGRDFVVKTRKNLLADFALPDKPDVLLVKTITNMILKDFLSGNIGSASILYTDFITTLQQKPKLIQILPIEKEALAEFLSQETKEGVQAPEYLFEPTADELLDFILNHYVETTVYQALLEALASEHSARMIAMKNATDNAEELVGDLTLGYNQLRQSNITKELLEITTAAAAMS